MFPNDPQKAAKLANALYIVLISAAFVLIARGITEVKTTANMGQAPSQNVISVSGTGDAYATPDIANISYDISQESKTVAEAQDSVTKRSNDILTYLKSIGVADKDIKTTNYNIYPHYEYNSRPVICYSGADCPSTNGQVFIGYVVTNSVQVKIRKIADAGSVLAELGSRKVTNLSNLYFSIENDDAVQASARKAAIEDAKQKAEVLAKDLGVSLVRIISFSEGGNYPIYAKTMSADSAYGMGGANQSATPSVPTGENKITSSVTIVYEIR